MVPFLFLRVPLSNFFVYPIKYFMNPINVIIKDNIIKRVTWLNLTIAFVVLQHYYYMLYSIIMSIKILMNYIN